MTLEAVDVFVKSALNAPFEDVAVKVLSEDGVTTYGLAYTDVDGKASFLLDGPATYQVRFFKRLVRITNPQLIAVDSPPSSPAVNQFDVVGEQLEQPFTVDPRLCMAGGFFRRPDGSPAANVDIHFIAKFKPVLLEGDAVVTERVSIRTDRNGYASLTLIRFGQYEATVEGMEDYQRCISVPDAANVNLPDLLFPRVEEVQFDPAGPYAMLVGDELTITPTVLTTSDVELHGTATSDVMWSSSDVNVASVAVTDTTLVLRAIGAGSATLICTRSDTSIISIPDIAIIGQPVNITVT